MPFYSSSSEELLCEITGACVEARVVENRFAVVVDAAAVLMKWGLEIRHPQQRQRDQEGGDGDRYLHHRRRRLLDF